jgi:hypothetical protein
MKSLVVVLVVLLAGCSCSSKTDRRPIRKDVVCDGCNHRYISGLLESFLDDAMYKPKSMFCLWKDEKQPSCVQIPKTFKSKTGSGVMKAKKEFKKDARNAINGGGSIGEDVILDEGVFKRRSVVIVNSKGVKSLGSSTDKLCRLAVVCDRSPSSRNSCKYEMLDSIYERWVYDCGYVADSIFIIGVPGYDRSTAMVPIKIYPPGNSVPKNISTLLRLRNVSRKVRETVDRVTIVRKDGKRASRVGSAIMECLNLLVTQKDIAHMIVLSDMRQVSLKLPFKLADTKIEPFDEKTDVLHRKYDKDQWWNFERHIPDPIYFIKRFRIRKLHMGLKGVRVDICGMHHNNSRYRWTADMSARLKDLWEKVFLSSVVDKVEFSGPNCPQQIVFLQSKPIILAHGGGLNRCGCHFNRKTGECHCHRDRGCGCKCQPKRCGR